VKVRQAGLAGALGAIFRPRYREVRAVEDVSFRIEPGEIVGFLGPNGAGKTTTIKILTGLLYPTSGRAEVAGFDPWRGGAPFKRRIALVLGNKQQLIWDLPPEETLLLNRAIYGLSDAEYRRAREELVDSLAIGGILDKPVRQLSQGERMRCELAAALLHRPELLFLDEPTTGLDPTSRQQMWDVIRELVADGTTVLLTTQYLEEADRLADSITVLSAGQVIAAGTSEELKSRVGQRTITATFRRPSEAQRAAEQLRKAGMEVTRDEQQAAVTIPVARARELADVVRVLDAADVEADDLTLREPTLDDVYLALTHRTPASTN